MNKQKQFIFELFTDKRYFDCIAETQRLLNYYKDISSVHEYNYLINSCYYLGGQYKTVVSILDHEDTSDWNETGVANLILLSNSYNNLQYYELSMQVLDKIKYDAIEQSARDILFKNKIILLLKDYRYVQILDEINIAEQYISVLSGYNPIEEFRKSINEYHELGLKSKWLSVSMSGLLPGSGQVYSGKIADGIISFLSVAGAAWGSYYFYKHDERPLAITLTFFTCLFYGGNLYSAYNSAEYTNLILKRSFSERITHKYNLYYNPAEYIDTEIFK